MTIRTAFFEAAAGARSVVGHALVGAGWDGPSALERFSLRGLAGHLVRGAGSVDAYLNRPEPTGADPLTAAGYYTSVVNTGDLDSALHRGVRDRGEKEAAGGHGALTAKLDAVIEGLQARLAAEPPGRLIGAFGDLVLPLDDYLKTRIVELVVHTDDLAVSVGIEPPEPSPAAAEVAVGLMLEVARKRHGDLAVVRAFSRRERDAVSALRVF